MSDEEFVRSRMFQKFEVALMMPYSPTFTLAQVDNFVAYFIASRT